MFDCSYIGSKPNESDTTEICAGDLVLIPYDVKKSFCGMLPYLKEH